ncbi:unnamed protein product, partial [Ectocarpus sp. 8 AP-2014]
KRIRFLRARGSRGTLIPSTGTSCGETRTRSSSSKGRPWSSTGGRRVGTREAAARATLGGDKSGGGSGGVDRGNGGDGDGGSGGCCDTAARAAAPAPDASIAPAAAKSRGLLPPDASGPAQVFSVGDPTTRRVVSECRSWMQGSKYFQRVAP